MSEACGFCGSPDKSCIVCREALPAPAGLSGDLVPRDMHAVAVVTNGYCDISTMEAYRRAGYSFVCSLPARQILPYAMETDVWTLFVRPPKAPA